MIQSLQWFNIQQKHMNLGVYRLANMTPRIIIHVYKISRSRLRIRGISNRRRRRLHQARFTRPICCRGRSHGSKDVSTKMCVKFFRPSTMVLWWLSTHLFDYTSYFWRVLCYGIRKRAAVEDFGADLAFITNAKSKGTFSEGSKRKPKKIKFTDSCKKCEKKGNVVIDCRKK